MSIRRRVRFLLALSTAAILAWAFAAPQASADTEIGSPGSGAGQLSNPHGVAVDAAAGLLYVSDAGNNRVAVFDANSGAFVRAFGWGVADGITNALQVCTTTCFKGLAGSGAGQFKAMQGIAVDDDPTSPAYHDIYVFDNGNHRVQRFTAAGAFVWAVGGDFADIQSGGVAVGPGGIVYAADQVGSGATAKSRVRKYEPSGAAAGELLLDVAGGSDRQTGVAVDSGGNIYVATNAENGGVRKYTPAGDFVFLVDPSYNASAVTIGPGDRFFVADLTGEHPDDPPISKILEYSSAGTPLRTLYGSFRWLVAGLALHSGPSGDFFTAEALSSGPVSSGVRHIEFPPPGPIVYPREILATGIGSTKATLKAKINPEGKATTYRFEYITDDLFKAAGDSFGAGTLSTPSTPLGFSDLIQHPVQASVTGLLPETLYHFRAVATNADGGPNPGPAVTFETKQPLELGAAWATEVGTDTATLHGEANPMESAAHGYFEYVDEQSFEVSGFAAAHKAPDVDAGAAPLDFGSGESLVERAATVFELVPATTYRYRFVATNRCKADPEIVCTFPGPALSFATFDDGPQLPSCPNDTFRTGPGALLPDCRGYEMVSPVEKNGADVDALANINGYYAGLEQAASDGQSITYSTYRAFGPIESAPYTNQYVARRDPSSGWSSEAISPQRKGPSLMTFQSAMLDRQYKAFGADLCQAWVVQDANPALASGGVEGFAGLYRRENCGHGTGGYEALSPVQPPNLSPERFVPELQGTSADGSVAIFSADDNLTFDAPPQPAGCLATESGCHSRLYEVREGQLRLVCVLPNGNPYPGSCGAGTSSAFVFGGAERTGTVANAISADGSRIFWSESATDPAALYVRIDGAETLPISADPARFWTAAADGSKAVYTVGGDLFSYDVDAEASTLIATGVQGVAGASEDAERIYFASSQVLVPGKGEAGQPNLYLYEAGAGFRWIGTLLAGDVTGPSTVSPVHPAPSRRVVRVTPDGEQIAFMSRASLTGYDNTDAVSGKADAEVFLYDSTAAGGSGELRCVSCNPSGARPVGRLMSQRLFETVWAAARIPAWQVQLYGSRVLSDDGSRLYFNSFEGLVARDTNGQEDVYQWQVPGSGTCTAASPSFVESSGGCLDLISSGESPKGSELLDIGADGNDVFFKTSQSLVKGDTGLIDIYDARVGGGFPPPPDPPAGCEGEACAPPAAPPNDPTPNSAGFRGPGNETTSPTAARKPCPKGKRKVRRAGKQRCVKQQNRKTSQRTKQKRLRR